MSTNPNAQLLEALLAFGIIVAVLLALADTRLYPLALGIAAIALLHVLLQGNSASTLANVINWAGSKIGGTPPPSGG